jgi:hypothetical protein
MTGSAADNPYREDNQLEALTEAVDDILEQRRQGLDSP